MKVFVLMGLPGSGKSWVGEQMIKELVLRNFVVCSADHFFLDYNGKYNFNPSLLPQAHGQCLRNFMRACELGGDHFDAVFVDNTNTTIAELAPYMAVAQAYGHEAEIIYVECPLGLAAKRNTHNVPLSAYVPMEHRLMNTLASIPPWWKLTTRPNGE